MSSLTNRPTTIGKYTFITVKDVSKMSDSQQTNSPKCWYSNVYIFDKIKLDI